MSANIREGKNLEDIQEMNRGLVIRIMRKVSECSRADIAKISGLKKATITNIVNDLINWGLVKETGSIEGSKGRRSIGIRLNGEKYKVIGIRLARNFYSVAMYDVSGMEDSHVTIKIDDGTNPETTLKMMIQTIREMIGRARNSIVLSIGVAIPGPFIRNEGRIVLMTGYPGWENFAIQEELQKAFDIPVYLEHDANAGALAEYWFGSHKEEKGTVLYILAGQGIGAGIVIDGNIYTGTLGVAGEIGHMSIAYDGPQCECGNRGCLTQYSSIFAIRKRIKKELANYPDSILHGDLSSESIIQAVKSNDPLAVKAIKEAAWYLGFGLSGVINILNPDVIIIGDELSKAGPVLLDVVLETVKAHILSSVYNKVRFCISSFDDPILIGAGALAIDKALSRPSAIADIAASFAEMK